MENLNLHMAVSPRKKLKLNRKHLQKQKIDLKEQNQLKVKCNLRQRPKCVMIRL